MMKASTTALATLALAGLSFGRMDQFTDFGSNPTGLEMFIERQLFPTPPNLAIIVHLHTCGSSAYSTSVDNTLTELAEPLGFMIIYPQLRNTSDCWDVESAASLTHNGGGDAEGIISMINHTIVTYAADATRVFVLGDEEGGSMANVMAGSYPDVFAAGAAYRGAGFACYAGSSGTEPVPYNTNQTCAEGIGHTPAQWGDFVRNAYPGYTGARPRMMIVNDLRDTLVKPQAGYETLSQWADVLGVTNTVNETGAAVEQGPEFTKLIYGTENKLVGYFGELEGGNQVTISEPAVLKFFGLQ